jgi:predicted carbohydrate-binding protein with CBM5 and CBM33 domain
MRTRTKTYAAAVGLATTGALLLSSGGASGHGYTDLPVSRQKLCQNGSVANCGSIQWEPQSVEGPKGLRSCSGGNSQFAELDDDSKGWRVTPVGTSHTFNWHHTARHATDTWQYFIGDTKIAEFDGRGAQPAADVAHQVNFGGFTGRQKVLAVWNVADTSNAFYACVDVNIGGGGGDGGGDGGGEPGDCAAPVWNAASVYTGGSTVSHDGRTWRAKWWVTGEEPGTTGEWGVWQDLGAC